MYKLVIFDVDGTLVESRTNIWEALFEKLEVEGEGKRLAEKFFGGEFNYATWAIRAFELLVSRGLTKKYLDEFVKETKQMQGAVETLVELKEKGKGLAVISGGLDVALNSLFPNTFDYIHINRISYDSDEIKFEPTPYGHGKYKEFGLRDLLKKDKVNVRKCVFVGNDFNDIEIARAVAYSGGLAIAFNPISEELQEVCSVTVQEKDLRAILPYILQQKI